MIDEFKSCTNCIHSADSVALCILRLCKHAIAETKECYEPKAQSTIEPKKGKWIDTGSGQECSECHEIQYGYDSFRYFCAFCGADMKEGEADES